MKWLRNWLLLAMVVASCKNEGDPLSRINSKIQDKNTGAFQKDLPKQYNDSSYYWKIIREMRSTTKLPSIENGSKEFQIRIWEDVDERRHHLLFLLLHDSNTWVAKGCIYKVTPLGVGKASLEGNLILLGEPKSGWIHFLSEILDKGIMDLRDESEIPGYRDATDLDVITVEIAAPKYYRYYELPGAYFQAKYVKDAKAMVDILELVKIEFPQLKKWAE